ncbi:MAG: hypothetical protein ABI723_05140 [Bacteroidia bacterium]
MNFQIVTEKPWWFIIFCVALGAVYSFILYRNDSQFSEVHVWLRRLMTTFRFLCVTFLAMLLLSPLIKTITRQVEKPIVIIAQDNSQSVAVGKDSSYYKNGYAAALTKLSNDLKDDYEVRSYSFGDQVKEQLDFNFNQKQTDFSKLFDYLSVQYDNRNLGAVIIASDGLFNSGSSPLYLSEKFKIPFYTIALGDTTVHKDLVLTRVNHNRVAFLGNSFPMEITVDARQCGGSKSTLTIEKDSAVLFQREVNITNDKFHLTVPVYLDAKTKGIQQYKISLAVLPGELSTANNSINVFVEVLESKQKVLLLAYSPHPDIGSIKNAIEASQNYEVKVAYAKDFDNNIKDYNLIILHQLPAAGLNSQLLFDKIKTTDVSLWYIIGSQTNIAAFNSLKAGLNIANANGKLNQVQADVNKNFSLFTLSEETKNIFSTLPPLISPFGVYKPTAESGVLFNQRIGTVTTDEPLMLFNETEGHKTALLCGEGLWRWGLKEYAEKNSRTLTNEFIQKIAQYLSVKESKTPFRVKYKNNVFENEAVVLDAELYNDAGELVNTPDVKIVITNSDKKSFPYTFSKTEKAYTLNAGYFPVGNYSFRADVKLGDKTYSQSGQFTVSALQVELSTTLADHQLLNAVAQRSGGAMVYPQQLHQISELLKARKDITSVSYTQKQLKDIINLKWVFFLLISLLTVEWFLRKRSGAY